MQNSIPQQPEQDSPNVAYVAAMQSAFKYVDALIVDYPHMSPFEVLYMAIDKAETEAHRGEGWGASSATRYRLIDEFNTWLIEEHDRLKKKMAVLERHGQQLEPLARMEDVRNLGLAVGGEFQQTAAEYFAVRERYNVFEDHYLSAVTQESEEFLDVRLPSVKLLWAWFEIEQMKKAQA
jgi:hypothetical protein